MMVKQVGRVLCLVAASACIGTVVMAGGDGKQKKEHVKPVKQSPFEKLDTDGNGSISLQEFSVMHDARMAKMKEKMGDKWTEEKAAKMQTAEVAFAKMDGNGDGAISAEEMSAKKPKGDGEKKKKDAGKPKAERKPKPAKNADKADQDEGGENADW